MFYGEYIGMIDRGITRLRVSVTSPKKIISSVFL